MMDRAMFMLECGERGIEGWVLCIYNRVLNKA